jgi:hypothetical protein
VFLAVRTIAMIAVRSGLDKESHERNNSINWLQIG